jgi:hypothetical protein
LNELLFALRYELRSKKQLSIEYRILSFVEGAYVLEEIRAMAEEAVEH